MNTKTSNTRVTVLPIITCCALLALAMWCTPLAAAGHDHSAQADPQHQTGHRGDDHHQQHHAGSGTATAINVVATLPDYASVARAIGGDRVRVNAIVRGDQDAHFIRPKPSFVDMVNRADVLIATGLDLELWLPTVVDKSGNVHVRSGRPGYVAAAQGMTLLEIPDILSRSEGGLHIYGNPHVTCSPLNMKQAARNITTGLTTNDPAGKEYYEANLQAFLDEIDRRLFGPELVRLLGGESLTSMAEKGALIPFLERQQFQGKPLIDSLGGWMKVMLPLRGMEMVTYHKNWVYFVTLFGLKEMGTVEPKPGIPPSPRHVTELVELMRERGIKVILAANYFDEQKIRTVASRVDAIPVIVPLYVGGTDGISSYFDLVDLWTGRLVEAAAQVRAEAGGEASAAAIETRLRPPTGAGAEDLGG